MSKCVVIVLACLFSINAMGQMDTQQMQYLKKIEKYRRTRNLGMVMVIAGATMGIVGFTRIINSTQPNDSDFYLFMAGSPFFSVGIPLSIAGHNGMRKYEKKLGTNQGFSFNMILTPQQRGLSLTYKF